MKVRQVEKPAELQDSLESSVSCLVLKCKAPSSFESHGDFPQIDAAEGQKAYSKYLRRIRRSTVRERLWTAGSNPAG